MIPNDSWSVMTDERMAAIATGLLDRTLPGREWTHEAHWMAVLYLLRHRADVVWGRYLPGVIWQYNEATGTPNSDTRGYHETITQFYLQAARSALERLSPSTPLSEVMRRVLQSPYGTREFPLNYWSRERLHSVQARRVWLDPDVRPIDFSVVSL